MLKAFWLVNMCFISAFALADDAGDALTTMAEKISETEKFSVTLLIRYDVLQASGQLIEFSERREMVLQRPQNLRVDVKESDGDEGGLLIDSSRILQYNSTEAVYSEIDRDGDVDGSIRYAVAKLGIRFPLARLLVANLPQELKKKLQQVDFVETYRLEDVPVKHLAAVGTEVDAQFWVREDNLPVRIVLTYKNEPGQPRFTADFKDWNLAPEIGTATFHYAAPENAEKIPFLVRSVASDGGTAQ